MEGYRCADSCGNLTVAKMDWETSSAFVESIPGIGIPGVENNKSGLCLGN